MEKFNCCPDEQSALQCCDMCDFQVCEGGDCVPYGSGVAYLPVSKYCGCPDVPEDQIDAYCEQTDFGAKCNFFKARVRK